MLRQALAVFSKQHRITIRRIVWRELQTRVAGTSLGLFHLIIAPLLFLLIFSYLFSAIFVSRWTGAPEGFGAFALRLYVGLIAFQFFSDVVNRSPRLVLENPSYVTKVVFPLEILVPTAIGVGLVQAGFSAVIFVLFHLIFAGLMPISAAAALLFVPPLVMFVAGLAWGLSALGVFLRDLSQIVSTLTPAIMFISPVFFPASAAPPQLRIVLALNPLSHVIEGVRSAIFAGEWPDPLHLALFYIISGFFALIALHFFLRLKGAFADVI